MSTIKLQISKAIRQDKWLYVNYHNKNQQDTNFYFAVKDVDIDKKTLQGMMFNPERRNEVLENITIQFENIKNAICIAELSYELPDGLINKLENLEAEDDFLDFCVLNNNIFLYLEQCLEFDHEYRDINIRRFGMLDQNDRESFAKNNRVNISAEQVLELLKVFKKNLKIFLDKHAKRRKIRLIFNVLSIKDYQGNKPLVFQEVCLDLEKRQLILNSKLHFYRSVLLKKTDSPQDVEEFINNFANNKDVYIEHICRNLYSGEHINTNPEFMELEYEFKLKFHLVRSAIKQMIKTNTLPAPIKAYLGKNIKRGGLRRNVTVITYDDRVNIDQLRVVFNALREYVTYVEGPPGTGKTQTILNIILSQFFAEQSTLICSHNNKAIENIVDKLADLSLEQTGLFLPIMRIGKQEIMKQTLSQLQHLYKQAITREKPETSLIKKRQFFVASKTNDISHAINEYERRLEIEEEIASIRCWKECHSQAGQLNDFLQEKLKELEDKLSKIPNFSNQDVANLAISAKENADFIDFLVQKSIHLLKKLENTEYQDFRDILEKQSLGDFIKYLKDDTNIAKLADIFPIWITTNYSAEKIASPKPHFDLCIMDEAGQCDIASSLISIIRAKRLTLIGDTQQLRPIIQLDPTKQALFAKTFSIEEPELYDFCQQSILSLMQKSDHISKKILLSYHYRCAKNIINYSNYHYYDCKLNVANPHEGRVELIAIDNKNSPARNAYHEETQAIIKEFLQGRFAGEKVAIITPFRNQVQLLSQELEKYSINNADVGTIHSVQGAEYDTVILSTSLSKSSNPRTFDWLKDNQEIINVAATRAKNDFVVVADMTAVEKFSQQENKLSKLCNYAKEQNQSKIAELISERKKQNFSNNSEYERYFYITVSQILTKYTNITVKRNVMMKEVFPNQENKFPDYYLRSEFDMVLYHNRQAILIMELDGEEHWNNQKRKNRDHQKELLCKSADIKLFRIPNHFASHYEFIKEYIKSLSKKMQQADLFT